MDQYSTGGSTDRCGQASYMKKHEFSDGTRSH